MPTSQQDAMTASEKAYAYLINLWEREPENGLVNLELARIAAQKGDTEQALRYYHNAIYAVWPGDQEVQRRAQPVPGFRGGMKIRVLPTQVSPCSVVRDGHRRGLLRIPGE
jgi:hypothetical protein